MASSFKSTYDEKYQQTLITNTTNDLLSIITSAGISSVVYTCLAEPALP